MHRKNQQMEQLAADVPHQNNVRQRQPARQSLLKGCQALFVKKKPRFFCDNCGREVGSETRSCPGCARFFASVRCPSCGFAGEDKLFLKGCPSCGYSDPDAGKIKPGKYGKHKPPAGDPLPSHVYIISAIVLLIFVAVLSYFVTR